MNKAVIAIHGGAGAIARAQMSHEQELRYIQALSEIVESGQKMLEAGDSALDVVTEAVRLLEACPLFNAGIGAVYTRDGTHELDACVMDGNTLKAGAVAGVSHVRHPVLAARLVMERSPHVLMVGEGAENFAFSQGMARVSPDIFSTPARYEQLLAARAAGEMALDHSGAPLDETKKWVQSARWRGINSAIWRRQRLPAGWPINCPGASATARWSAPGVMPTTPASPFPVPERERSLFARSRLTISPH